MIVLRLKGGLGNQMFQYALGRVLSLKNNSTFGLDVSFYKSKKNRHYDLDVFNIVNDVLDDDQIPFLYKVYRKIKFIKHKGKERFFHFDSDIFSKEGELYLDGYWQSPKYFSGFESVIRNDFSLKKNIKKENKVLVSEIQNSNSVCVHVRRGDFISNKFHDVLEKDYYNNAVKILEEKTIIENIFVFSDDINWCKENMKFGYNTFFVGEEFQGEKGEGHIFLMSQCKNFIIPNSTFSWWGAWLSTYEKKIIICPQKWFSDKSINTNDLIPDNWIRL